MSDKLEIVRSIARSFQERKDGWTRREGRNLAVVNDELGIEVQEFAKRGDLVCLDDPVSGGPAGAVVMGAQIFGKSPHGLIRLPLKPEFRFYSLRDPR